jgi:Flp pilus assembly protein CpaB
MESVQRLISTRRGGVILAVLAAVLAGTLILVYVNRYRNSVRSQSAPVTVLVASTTIAKGTPGNAVASKALYTTATLRESQLLDGAFSDPSSLAGRAATRTIYKGQQLTAAEFAGSALSLDSSLTDHERVIAIPLDSAHGLLGQLAAGDRVDVYAGFNITPVSSNGTPLAGGQGRPVLRLIMQNIQVISTGNGGTGTGASSDVSLKVNDQQAADLAYAVDNGRLWLTLRPSSGAKPSSPNVVTAETILLGIPPIEVVHSFGGH